MQLSKTLSVGLMGLAVVGATAFAPIASAKNEKNDKDKKEIASKKLDVRSNVSVAIGNNGVVHVHNATVTAVSGSTVTAATSWGSAKLSWTVNTNASTELLSKTGKIALADIKVGDTVNFQGALDANASGLTVTAKVLRDVSVTKEVRALLKDIFQGTLQSISSTTTPASLSLKIGDKTFSVNVTGSTHILNRNFAATTLASFQTGDTVRVYGSLASATSTTINALIVRDATR